MDLTNKIEITQREVCADYGAIYCPSPFENIIGISAQVKKGEEPIHGLRHPLSEGTNGWYVWAGEYSEDPDFFKPIHTEHIMDLYPSILKFLGLPPGWRFLKAHGYEDVWYDGELLKV
ncbi:hypothetical protein DES40_1785 [Litorimonas taeanensis]|uniref:Imm33-like domain-containing protein n=1 Tax=Litorimonas taeanensis TaxID=568099 RepID=A0A420WDF0_9PROT|nr:hypothetical protein [Litorimonas taeanensis]RKQ69008.1 hypothetical protein DES40_1785 [Litorimonas taeanensis]